MGFTCYSLRSVRVRLAYGSRMMITAQLHEECNMKLCNGMTCNMMADIAMVFQLNSFATHALSCAAPNSHLHACKMYQLPFVQVCSQMADML